MQQPERIGRFPVVRLLGSGTFATVWLARDADLDADVAIKVLAENWSLSEDAQRRFLEEARALRALDSDRILRVYEVGRLDDGRPFMVMEYADAGTLQDRMEARAAAHDGYSVDEALAIAIEIADCMIEAHQRQIIHRDLKPSNVMFRTVPAERQDALRRAGLPVATERFLLGDFGIARKLEGALGQTMVVGTPHYMAPEQADPATASSADYRSDVYAAAVVLYELLAGRVPFPYESVGRVQRAQIEEAPQPLSSLRPGIPAAVADVVARGLQPDPGNRFGSAWEWRDALRAARTASAQTAAGAPGTATITGGPPDLTTAGLPSASATPPPPTGPPGAMPPQQPPAAQPPSGPPGQPPAGPPQGPPTGPPQGPPTGPPQGPPTGPASTGPGGPSEPSRAGSTGKKVAALLVVIALGAGAGVFLARSQGSGPEVILEASTATGDDPFTEATPAPLPTETTPTPTPTPTVTLAPSATETPTPEPTDVPSLTAPVRGRYVPLYGGSGSLSVCDKNHLIAFLATHTDKAFAWARVHGIGVGDIPSFIRSLRIVVTNVDLRVTNHGFRNGIAIPKQSVLQAGTALLVDALGHPKVRCKCGNPLLAPHRLVGKVKYRGPKWVGFEPTATVAAEPAVEPTAFASPILSSPSETATPAPTPTPTPTPTITRPPPTIVALSTQGAAKANSTFSSRYAARYGADGRASTSWFSRGPGAGAAVFTVTLRAPATVTRVSFIGNRRNADPAVRQGFGFGSWKIDLLNNAGNVLRTIRPQGSTTADTTATIPGGVAGVRFVRFTGTQHQSSVCGGLAELLAYGFYGAI